MCCIAPHVDSLSLVVGTFSSVFAPFSFLIFFPGDLDFSWQMWEGVIRGPNRQGTARREITRRR